MKTNIRTIIFLCCLCISSNSFALSDKIYKDLSTFSKVLEVIDQYYVKPVDEKKVITGAIDGMLSSLDPHSMYFTPDAYKDFDNDTKGRFGGIGIEVTLKGGLVTVVAPIDDSPAWRAGIKAGDRIVSIDGESTRDMTLGLAAQRMRGSLGKKITLGIWHAGKMRTVVLTREVIDVPSVKVEDLGEGYALFRITNFQENVARDLENAVEKFDEKNPLKGLILDVRDNPGGLLPEAIKIADYFIEGGVIVSTRGRNQVLDVHKAHQTGTFRKIPIAVLINGGSASASEILAAALSDNKRATLLGTQSFGKGSVQTVINLDNGDAVKITIAYYYTPHDKLIDSKGIAPDVNLDEKAYRKKMNIKSDAELTVTREEFDAYQKSEALEYLKKMGK